MASAVLYAILLVSLTLAVHKCGGLSQKIRCDSQPACFNLLNLERLVQHVSKNMAAADAENILLKSRTFDNIRKQKYLHSCVLREIINFYQNVLSYTWDNTTDINQGVNYNLQLISIMDQLRNCIYKMNGRCEILYRKAARQPNLEILEADMTPEEVAIYQLQKLKFASERLNDLSIQERAMDELQSLHNYIPGKGFRKTKQMME